MSPVTCGAYSFYQDTWKKKSLERYPFSAGWTGGMVLDGYSQQINAGEKEDG